MLDVMDASQIAVPQFAASRRSCVDAADGTGAGHSWGHPSRAYISSRGSGRNGNSLADSCGYSSACPPGASLKPGYLPPSSASTSCVSAANTYHPKRPSVASTVCTNASTDDSHLQGFSELCGLFSKLLDEPGPSNDAVESRMIPSVPTAAPRYSQSPGLVVESHTPMADATEVVNAEPDTQCCNPGSSGHPELCSRKCLFFVSGCCTNGEDCKFCHMPHQKRPVRLDRMNRDLLRNMQFLERAVIIVPILKEKVHALGLCMDATMALERAIDLEHPGFVVSELAPGQNMQQMTAPPKLKMLRNALKLHNMRLLIMLLKDADFSSSLRFALEPLEEQMCQY